MRNRIIILLLTLFSLTACVYDRYKPEHCADEPLYLAFILNGTTVPVAPATKASTSESSWTSQAVSEQLVSRVDLYFYTGGGQYLGKHTQTDFKQAWNAVNGNISNEVGQFAVKLDYRPYRMLVTVNSAAANSDLTGLTLQQARARLQQSTDYCAATGTTIKYMDGGAEYTLNGVKPFYMSSSTYLNEKKVEICDLLIPNTYVRQTEAEALAKPIPVYLERLAAKVTLRMKKKEYMVPVITSQDSLTAKVTIKGWNVNAVNKSSYYFKKVQPAWDFAWKNGTARISWNNAGKYRSYWAEDANYDRPVNGGIKIEQNANLAPPADDAFIYRKPSQLDLDLPEVTESADPNYGYFVQSAYCLENTSDTDVLPVSDSEVPAQSLYSRATHVLIKAQLSFSPGAGSNEDEDAFASATDFFRYQGMFYTWKGLLKALRQDTRDNGNPLDGIADSDLQIVSAHDRDYCAPYDKGERMAVQRISDASYPDLRDAAGNPVRIDGFLGGEFYYKIPIEHINNEDVKQTDTYYPIARYAVVRNHQYEITIGEKLGGIGTGIGNPNYDIRPFRKTDDYRVTAYVRVSPWLQFETRFLFVDPSGLLVTDGHPVLWWEDEGDPLNDGINDWTGNGWYF